MTPRIKNVIPGNRAVAAPSIAAGFARALVELAAAKSADRHALAERAGIDLALLDDQDNRVPFTRYIALMRAAKELTGDAALGLHFGEAFDISELSIVGLMGQACETMAEAFEQLERFTRLIIDVEVDDPQGRRLVLQRENGLVWVVDTRRNPNDFIELTESAFARMVSRARAAMGNTGMYRAVHFTHEAPAYLSEYERIFGVPITFGSDRNAVLMADDTFLDIKPSLPSRYVFGVLSARAEALLKSLENATSTRAQVESLLMPLLHTGQASMDVIAERMGLSRPTLSRRLKAEGVTFEKVLDALRHRLALDYLSSKKVSVNEAAYLVGFSEAAAFSRAVKRWTGSSPRALRRS